MTISAYVLISLDVVGSDTAILRTLLRKGLGVRSKVQDDLIHIYTCSLVLGVRI